ncbi:prepilin-type N-terminal cleavage/methylation domain-containing protein [Deefgea tanakiae]|uniref:Prepilin-type N-terminal cleavage/methylation domain-containing protein n=1 Tax=Deefgea tanakiae TaxID=2865840 RepID=A0ABX8Z2H0_9NEIS|nr:type IV pilin protein [Deefgea tanakiae]QZA76442.1 prepilin-type N-terminal cleavage/methylation domain-containing protein [Deefgea tanakiae]
MNRKQTGFTLIEMMIVVAIIGILAAIAIPNYQDYVRKSRRTDGVTAISTVQQAQEKWRANNVSYSENFGTAGLNLVTTGGATVTTFPSSENFYDLVVTTGTATGTGYTLVATAKGKQTSDTNCQKLILTVTNGNAVRTSQNASGTTATSGCW